jgi:hypothetical protein
MAPWRESARDYGDQGLAAAHAPTITSAERKPEENAAGAIFAGMRRSLWHASAILKVFAGILVALYMLGASALSAALLFYLINLP